MDVPLRCSTNVDMTLKVVGPVSTVNTCVIGIVNGRRLVPLDMFRPLSSLTYTVRITLRLGLVATPAKSSSSSSSNTKANAASAVKHLRRLILHRSCSHARRKIDQLILQSKDKLILARTQPNFNGFL